MTLFTGDSLLQLQLCGSIFSIIRLVYMSKPHGGYVAGEVPLHGNCCDLTSSYASTLLLFVQRTYQAYER